jgi:TolB protein
VIVYQLLAGKLPYQADTPMSVIYAHLHEPLPDIRAVKPDLPKGIKAVLEKALAKERNNRYPTARDFALALARAASTTVPKAAEMLADAPETEVVDVGEETRAEEKPLQGDAGQREAADKTVRLHDLDKPQPAPERKFNMPRWGWLAGGGVIILLLLARGLSGNIPAILANETPGATLTSTPASTRTITPVPFGGGNRILFVSDRDGNAEIYLMNADGSDAINLTNHIGEDTAPQWSPDGSRILFKSSRDGGSDLFVMNADGSEITNLTNPFFDDEAFPIWSPDSSRILFTVDLDGDRDIFTIEVDSGRLTNLIDNTVDDFGSVWSPDGSQIAFGSTRSGDGDLFVMDADGGNVLQLTQNKRIGGPVWSPDGARIAYTIFLSIQNPSSLSIGLIDADGGNGVEIETGSGIPFRKFWTPDGSALFAHMVSGLTGLYTLFISADGSEETELPGELAEIGAVSPDGSQVAYVAAGDGVDFLNLYELDSANERTLVELAEEASSLQWSPDGGYILFLAGEESEAEIFVVDVQSGELVQITDNQVEESAPSWLP